MPLVRRTTSQPFERKRCAKDTKISERTSRAPGTLAHLACINFVVEALAVASSQAVYSEGAGECPKHSLVFPSVRPIEQLHRGDWQVHCPICGEITKSVPTPENTPVGGETVYGLTKVDQERLVLLWGKQVGIPTVALRYSCTFGPRQSIFNPYTGVIAIFCTRLLNNLPPVLY